MLEDLKKAEPPDEKEKDNGRMTLADHVKR